MTRCQLVRHVGKHRIDMLRVQFSRILSEVHPIALDQVMVDLLDPLYPIGNATVAAKPAIHRFGHTADEVVIQKQVPEFSVDSRRKPTVLEGLQKLGLPAGHQEFLKAQRENTQHFNLAHRE